MKEAKQKENGQWFTSQEDLAKYGIDPELRYTEKDELKSMLGIAKKLSELVLELDDPDEGYEIENIIQSIHDGEYSFAACRLINLDNHSEAVSNAHLFLKNFKELEGKK